MQPEITFNRGAVNPVQCISGGWELLRGVYGNFLGVMIVAGLIMIVGSCIPLAPLNAPMLCGLYLCLLARIHGQPFNTSTLFKGFDYFGQSFIASLFVTVPMFLLSLVLQFGMGGFRVVLENMKIDEKSRPEDILPLVGGFVGFIAVALVALMFVSIVLNGLMIFVYPLIVEHKLKALEAVKLGFRAVLGNFFGVFALAILEVLLIFAGAMLFYIGALFVAPVIFAARIVAYRKVFPAQTNPQELNMGSAQVWSPQMITSKAGWYLTASALLIVGLGAAGIVGLSLWSYAAITETIRKVQEQNARRETSYYPTPSTSPYKFPTTNSNSTSNAKPVSGGILNDKAVELPEPVYPPAARAAKASGFVIVQVTVDEKGEVANATALSGHALLKSAAEQAARKAKFKPTLQNGKAVPVKGIITYNFPALG